MYDLIIEIAHTVWRNGFGLTALGTAVFVLLKQRKVKKQLRKYIPWLLEDESETKQYVANQQRIEMKVDLLLQERGIECNVITLNESSRHSVRRNVLSSESHSATNIIVQPAGRFTKLKEVVLMKSKWKSRKFWMSIIAAALVIANEGLDLGISTETVMTFSGLIASFIFSEAYVDAKKKTDVPGDTGPAE